MCGVATEVHALGLARLDDLQLRGVAKLFGALLRHALAAETFSLEGGVCVGEALARNL